MTTRGDMLEKAVASGFPGEGLIVLLPLKLEDIC